LFELEWTDEASNIYDSLKKDTSHTAHYKSVKKAIKLLAQDPRHNSLQTHEYKSLVGPNGEKVFEAYAEQNTPNAYRIFWYYGPNESDSSGKRISKITIFTIAPHPK
jgi:hypothetical protein